jgi:L-ascorbate metabolism protein UlaG (beta-lactamase superfamily)
VKAGLAAGAASILLGPTSSQALQQPSSTAPNDGTQYQAKAPKTLPMTAKAFRRSRNTTLRWLGGAGFFVNSRGTTLMVDPVLEGFDMRVMIDMPILPNEVPHLDAVLITHSDTDHYSVQTCKDLARVCQAYHSTKYVASLMNGQGLPASGHDIAETFRVGDMSVQLLPVDHAWQNSFPEMKLRHFNPEDACGFLIETPDGTVWATGDSKLLPKQLTMPTMDAILFDYSEDSQFHFGLEGAVRIANAYPETPLLLGHWGTVDAPAFAPFNGDPKHLISRAVNPDRIKVLAPGEPYQLKRLRKA